MSFHFTGRICKTVQQIGHIVAQFHRCFDAMSPFAPERIHVGRTQRIPERRIDLRHRVILKNLCPLNRV